MLDPDVPFMLVLRLVNGSCVTAGAASSADRLAATEPFPGSLSPADLVR